MLLDRPVDDPATALERLRRGAGDLLTRVLPEPEAGLAAGILIGLRDRVDRDLAADLHDGRRQPRRRDLRLEHRDRRGGDRGAGRPARASPTGAS